MAKAIRELVTSLNDTRVRLGGLEATAAVLRNQHSDLEAEVAQARARITMAPRVQQMLEALQASAHARTIGAYEAILSGLVQDVMGQAAGQVRLTTSQRNGQPALDVDLIRDGKVEDVYDSNGGALTNVVCAGLRFAVIARSGLRRFLVLDEPDCWLRPDRVPVFFRALAAVCDQAGFQAVVVSHHPVSPEDLPASVSFINLSLVDGRVEAESKLSAAPTTGITHLWAQNLRRHHDTFVSFGPGLTLLTGPNNCGKSTLIGGLRALACGGAQDSQITHDADEMSVEVGLIDDAGEAHRISLTRKRKGSPRVLLQHLNDADDVLHEERGAPSTAPEWVEQLLGIHEIESMDPQLLGQKTPVFLLDQPASMRARLLYAGREAAYLARMFEEQNRQLREDKKCVGRGALVLDSLAARLERLGTVSEARVCADGLLAATDRLSTLEEKTRQLGALLPKLAVTAARARLDVSVRVPPAPSLRNVEGLVATARRIDALKRRAHVAVPAIPMAPSLRDIGTLAVVVQRLSQATRLASVANRAPSVPPAPTLRDVMALRQVAVNLKRANQAAAQLAQLPGAPTVPALRATSELERKLRELELAQKRVSDIAAQAAEAAKALTSAKAEIESLLDAVGHTCPLCHQSMDAEHLHV